MKGNYYTRFSMNGGPPSIKPTEKSTAGKSQNSSVFNYSCAENTQESAVETAPKTEFSSPLNLQQVQQYNN